VKEVVAVKHLHQKSELTTIYFFSMLVKFDAHYLNLSVKIMHKLIHIRLAILIVGAEKYRQHHLAWSFFMFCLLYGLNKVEKSKSIIYLGFEGTLVDRLVLSTSSIGPHRRVQGTVL